MIRTGPYLSHSHQLTEVSHQLTLKHYVPVLLVSSWEDHSRQWTCPTGSSILFEPFGSLLHMPGHTWWNDLLLPEHFLPSPSQVPGIENSDGPAPGDEWPWYFQGVLLAVWLWKLNMGNISLCAPSPEQPCEARRTCHAWDQACIPGPNGQPHHGHPLRATSL